VGIDTNPTRSAASEQDGTHLLTADESAQPLL